MMRHTLSAVIAAGLLLGCGTAREEAADAPAAQAAARASVSQDLFATTTHPGAQMLFVGQTRPGEADAWPGAVFLPMSTFSVERDGIPNEFPRADSLAALLEAAGVRGGRVMIVGDPIPAGRAYAAFDYLGLGDRAVLLDGGRSALGAPPQAAATETSNGRLNASPNNDMIVGAEWVHAQLNDPTVVILDARPPADFSGATPGEGIDRPGHIPGARNVFWQTLVQSASDARLKPEAELRRIFREAGVDDGDTIVAYCRTGGQASFLYAVARHLGYDVRLYDGSFIDWSRTQYPVERD